MEKMEKRGFLKTIENSMPNLAGVVVFDKGPAGYLERKNSPHFKSIQDSMPNSAHVCVLDIGPAGQL